jgi:hypothetical protein
LQDNNDSAILAETSLVSGIATNVSGPSNQASNMAKPFTATKLANFPSKSGSVQTDCMAAINREFRAKGFSKKVRKLLTASWRSGTQKDYASKFKRFSSWCSAKQIDTYSASLTDCAEFLASLYYEGLQYKTIAGYRSMLSSVLQPVGKFPVGQHPYIIRLLKGVFNLRPPITKLLPEWDLPKVLKAIQKYPFEPLMKTSLKYVTYKAVFLTAITTYRRVSDLQALKLGEGAVLVQSEGVTFVRQGLAKQDRPNHCSSKIFVPKFKDNKLLDPKRALAIYLKKTEPFRRKDGKDETSLFLTINRPHTKASAQRLSSYIVSTIREAYEDKTKSVKAHSTRALGPSWALFKGASLKSVLEAADWSKETTFIKFYRREVTPYVLCE